LLDDNDPLTGKAWTNEQACFKKNAPKLLAIQNSIEAGDTAKTFFVIDRTLHRFDIIANGDGTSVHLPTPNVPLTDADMVAYKAAVAAAGHTVSTGAAVSYGQAAKELNGDITALRAKLNTEGNNIAQDNGLADIVSGCAQASTTAVEYSYALDVGVGAVWSGKDGAVEDLNSPSASLWIGARAPLEFLGGCDTTQGVTGADNESKSNFFSCWLVGGSLRYAYQSMVNTGNTTTPKIQADVLDTWIGLEHPGDLQLGSVDHPFKIDAQVGYLDQHAVDPDESQFSKSGTRWLVSGSFDLLPESGVWLEASYGTAQGTASTLNDRLFMVSLNFSAPKASSIFGAPTAVSSKSNQSTGTGGGAADSAGAAD
jgi:hypothetical protein